MPVLEVRTTSIFDDWFGGLRDRQAKSRIDARIRRLSLGNPGDVRPVGQGVSEMRIYHGPGYRVYFVQRGDLFVVLQRADYLAMLRNSDFSQPLVTQEIADTYGMTEVWSDSRWIIWRVDASDR